MRVEPIDDEELLGLRYTNAGLGKFETVQRLIARLDLAEAEVARLRSGGDV